MSQFDEGSHVEVFINVDEKGERRLPQVYQKWELSLFLSGGAKKVPLSCTQEKVAIEYDWQELSWLLIDNMIEVL